jgi:hypothetical protein
MHQSRRLRILFYAYAVRMGGQKAPVAARRVQQAVGYSPYRPSNKGMNDAIWSIVSPLFLFVAVVHQ